MKETYKENHDGAKCSFFDPQGKGLNCESIDRDCISDAEREIDGLTKCAPLNELYPEEKGFEPSVNNPPSASW